MSETSFATPAAEGAVAPGQEELVSQLQAEQEAASQSEEAQKILGKFNSAEELAKAYQQLERKLGQSRDQAVDAEPEAPAAPQEYNRESSVNDYGEFLSDKFEEAQLNPYEMAAAWERGDDVSSYVEKLTNTGIPKQVIEQYLARPEAQAQAPAEGGLTDSDVAELKGMVGGDQQFQQLSQWAASNLNPQELADYNAAVDSGNKHAIRWALRTLQARSADTGAREPELIGGGTPSKTAVFESQAEVIDAMNKTNDRGQRLYEVDTAYRRKVEKMLAASDVFG
jgi:hypothetical protein